jgi:zinc/manganese transport system substrate-binding protein
MFCFKPRLVTTPMPRKLRRQSLRSLLSIGLVAAALVLPAHAESSAARLKVVATFSILGDFAKIVGGGSADVRTLVGADGDVHVYMPTAGDADAIRQARLVIVNGLGLEGWLPRLVEASGGHAITVVATEGVAPRTFGAGHQRDRREVGSVDPHAWQSVKDAEIYVSNIRDAMMAANPANAVTYQRNAAAYLAKLEALDSEVRHEIAQIPNTNRKVISTHDAFGYFAQAYGMTFIAPQGISIDSEPSAGDVAAIIAQIRTQHIPAVFLENIADPRLMKQIAAETGARIGGTLYSDSLTGARGEAPTYVDLVRHNVQTIVSALTPER